MARYKALAAIRFNGLSVKSNQEFDADPQHVDIRAMLSNNSIIQVDGVCPDIKVMSCEGLPVDVTTASGTRIAASDLVIKAMVRVGLTLAEWNALPPSSRATAIGDLQLELSRLVSLTGQAGGGDQGSTPPDDPVQTGQTAEAVEKTKGKGR